MIMSANPNRVLVLSEDEKTVQELLSELQLLGYLAFCESYAELEIEAVLRLRPDVIVFNLSCPDEDVLQIYQWLKNNTRLDNQHLGIIALVPAEELANLSLALEFDDVVSTPHQPEELAFRLRRLLWRKSRLADPEVIKLGDLIIYLARYEVWVESKRVELTLKEYELLKYLATHRGRVFNRESLLNIVWGYDYYGGSRTVDVHVRRIRAKIGDEDEVYIKTVRGVGYMFRE